MLLGRSTLSPREYKRNVRYIKNSSKSTEFKRVSCAFVALLNNIISYIGGFLLGLFLPLIGILGAYIFTKDRNFIKWAWIGTETYFLILLFGLRSCWAKVLNKFLSLQ
jgi:hypothetical protein